MRINDPIRVAGRFGFRVIEKNLRRSATKKEQNREGNGDAVQDNKTKRHSGLGGANGSGREKRGQSNLKKRSGVDSRGGPNQSAGNEQAR